jgi:hypothetical protein
MTGSTVPAKGDHVYLVLTRPYAPDQIVCGYDAEVISVSTSGGFRACYTVIPGERPVWCTVRFRRHRSGRYVCARNATRSPVDTLVYVSPQAIDWARRRVALAMERDDLAERLRRAVSAVARVGTHRLPDGDGLYALSQCAEQLGCVVNEIRGYHVRAAALPPEPAGS